MAPQNTGRKNAQGRTIWQGPRGGLYVLTQSGRHGKPAVGRKPATKATKPTAANTGTVDGKGRPIFRGPRGGLFVLGAGNTRLAPAKGQGPLVFVSAAGRRQQLLAQAAATPLPARARLNRTASTASTSWYSAQSGRSTASSAAGRRQQLLAQAAATPLPARPRLNRTASTASTAWW
jgi:hypothetical protein